MRMRFGPDDDQAYPRARDELVTRFAAWAQRHGVAVRPSDAGMLMDWKVGYSDGRLDHWSPDDVEEFLLGWCPRKLSAPPDLCAEVPGSVAAFVEFLAHEGLLGRGSPPSAVRAHVERITPRFVRGMADPANYGLAKSLFAGVAAGADDPLARLAELTGTSHAELLEMFDPAPRIVGPVRLPPEDAVAAAVAECRVLSRIRALAARCAAPGLALTATGDLQRADAEALVAELGTGDDLAAPAAAASRLPELSWTVRVAREAGAVRRHKGRLVAVERSGPWSDRAAHGLVVRSALVVGLLDPVGGHPPWYAAVAEELEEQTPYLLAELLDAGPDGLPLEELLANTQQPLDAAVPGLTPAEREVVDAGVRGQIERLAALGLVTAGDPVLLTAAGTAVGVELVSDDLGMDVLVRADPATADVAELVESVLMLPPGEAAADLACWAARGHDLAELLGALLVEGRESGAVLGLLQLLETVEPAQAAAAAMAHREGPHGPVVTMWLMTCGALDPRTVERGVVLDGTVAVAAGMLDTEGPDAVVELVSGGTRDETLTLLREVWRADHERTADVLDALGRHHPDKQVAKAARTSLMKLRNR